MRKTPIIIAVLTAVLATSCEKDLPYTSEDWFKQNVTVDAVATCDTTFTATIIQANPYSRLMLYSESTGRTYDEKQEADIIKTAEAKLTVNGTDSYPMTYDESAQRYVSSYVPEEGDDIHIDVSTSMFGNATATATVPRKPEIEVSTNSISQTDGNDSILVDMSLTITDPSGENYYRLIVRAVTNPILWSDPSQSASSSAIPSGPQYKRFASDVFYSDDDIFLDTSLTKGFGGWPAFMTNVFSDNGFDGRTYTVSIRKKCPNGSIRDNEIYVELQSLSKELYHYLKSVQWYRIQDSSDFYANDLYIYSNVVGGWGILGGLSASRVTVPVR